MIRVLLWAVPKQPIVTAAEAFSESLAGLIKSTEESFAQLKVTTIPESEAQDSAP